MLPQKIGIAFLFFVTYSTTTVEAQYRSHHRSSSYHRHATAMVQAQKAQMINVLQSQVVLANQILINAESKSAMSQSLAYEAMSKLNHIRKEMESAHADVHHAFQEVQMIEADILAGQDDHSEFAEATRAVDNSNQEVHRVFHKLAQTPEEESISTNDTRLVEMSRLPESERIKIKNDSEYKLAINQLSIAEQQVLVVRKKLMENSKEWRDAKRNLDKTRHDSREEIEKAKPLSIAASNKNQETLQLRNVVENAKLMVAQGELRLRQLGAKPLKSDYGKR